MTPYTTKTGIKIGLLYQAPPPQITPDAEFIQSVLLNDRSVFQERRYARAVLVASAIVLLGYLLVAWTFA